MSNGNGNIDTGSPTLAQQDLNDFYADSEPVDNSGSSVVVVDTPVADQVNTPTAILSQLDSLPATQDQSAPATTGNSIWDSAANFFSSIFGGAATKTGKATTGSTAGLFSKILGGSSSSSGSIGTGTIVLIIAVVGFLVYLLMGRSK